MVIEQIILLALISTIAPIITAGGVYFLGRYLNVGPLTTEVREERGALVATLRERMEIAEKDIATEKRKNMRLREELAEEQRKNSDLTDRVTALEDRIIKMAVGEI